MSDRKYPDIDFVETDTETIESNLIALYENFVQQVPGRERYKVYPASPERLFISWVANIIVQQRVIINETAKKNVPRYADGEYLDSLAGPAGKRAPRREPERQNRAGRCQQARRLQCSDFIYHRRRNNQ